MNLHYSCCSFTPTFIKLDSFIDIYLTCAAVWSVARYLHFKMIPNLHGDIVHCCFVCATSWQSCIIRGCSQKFPDWIYNEIYAYLWCYSLRCNTKGYGGNTHYTDSQNSDTTAPSVKELYHLQSRSKRPVRKLLDTPS